MNAPTPRTILGHGLASGNAGLVQLLGLCPLLAVSHDAASALGLGVATLVALTATGTLVSALRRLAGHELRLPAYALIVASVVTAIELAMRAAAPALHAALGLFVPLIATNCILMVRAERFATRHDPARAALDGFAAGLGFLWVLLAIGIAREFVGKGTFFAGAGTLLGLPGLESAVPAHRGFLLAATPAGAFLVLAALVALRQHLLARGAAR